MTAQDGPAIRNVLYPVADVTAAADFYHAALSIPVRFLDGPRFAALDAGITLALVSPDESVAGSSVAASFRVADLAATLDAVVRAGGAVHLTSTVGPHETRAVAEDPWGNRFILYKPNS